MSYMHIGNLYKDQRILLFRECYAMEKIHGTSSHLKLKDGKLTFFSGGSAFQNFVALFNIPELTQKFIDLGRNEVTVFGEAYGGKMQGMAHTYGPNLKFIAFEVCIDEYFLKVENAHNVCDKLGLDFVHYVRIPTNIEDIDRERDAPSVQAVRNGITEPKKREGVVLRPIEEFKDSSGGRVLAKHKGEGFCETKTPRSVDAEQFEVLSKAKEIADEWCVSVRLEHVLDAFPDADMKDIPKIIEAMYDDIIREAKGEIIDSKDVKKAIFTRTAILFKQKLVNSLHKEQ